ncbi:MAG TPA: hypothetical protein VKB34_23000, partial [Povalibacter sp.]|nr:hypothetical protein [Povalibacter sp.]
VALDGSAMTIDSSSNELFYGRPGVLASEIIRSDAPSAPAPAPEFIAVIQRSAAGTPATASTATPATPTPSTQQPAPQPQPAQEGSLTTYPMEDSTPGAEPPQ